MPQLNGEMGSADQGLAHHLHMLPKVAARLLNNLINPTTSIHGGDGGGWGSLAGHLSCS